MALISAAGNKPCSGESFTALFCKACVWASAPFYGCEPVNLTQCSFLENSAVYGFIGGVCVYTCALGLYGLQTKINSNEEGRRKKVFGMC